MRTALLSLLLALPAAVAATSTPAPDRWIGFHNGNGNLAAPQELPVSWSPEKGIAWQVELPGYGQSTPVVWGNRVFVTSIEGANKDQNRITALSVETGKVLWSQSFPTSMPVEATTVVSRAAPTPCVDGDRLYAFFESGDLYALDHAGKLQWQRSLTKEYGKLTNEYGLGSSPAQNADSLFLLVEDSTQNYLLAVDKATGRNRWKQARENRVSYSSPVVARVGDREEVLVSSKGVAQGIDPATGMVRWQLDGLSGNSIPTPVVEGDTVYLGAAADRGAPAANAPAAWSSVETNCALRLVMKDGKPSMEVAWKGKKPTCGMMAPQPYQGLVYTVNSAGTLFCLDAKSGEEKYAERLEGGSCWAQALPIGDRIYLFGKTGTINVIKAGPAYEKLATNRLWKMEEPPLPSPAAAGKQGPAGQLDPVIYGVAVAHDSFFVRLGTRLYRVTGK